MSVIIYRKADLVCVDKVIRRTPEEQITEYIRVNSPGTFPEDYEAIETELQYFHLENVDGVVVAVEDIPIPPPPEPSETDIWGQQLVELELRNLELEQENQMLGQQLVDMDLRLLAGGL